jgi:nicotinate-nucleotide pyrophosphorylase (carboxylating)
VSRGTFEPLHLTRDLRDRIRHALAEDVGDGDVTTSATVAPALTGRAVIIARAPGIVCGLPVVAEVFRSADSDLKTTSLRSDGDRVIPDLAVFEIRGRVGSILVGERLALNFLQRLAGIATLTQRFVDALGDSTTRIYDTRKTTPLWRDLEKYAVRVGGGMNHRLGLYDMILIKNNHADFAGGLREAIRRAKRARQGKRGLLLEAEARTLEEVRVAVEEKVDMILLDNFTPGRLKPALREIPPTIVTEASGGMTLRRVRRLADLGLDRISVGALTHSARAVDFALRHRNP